ncbi:hypothetical protein Celaphus_00007359 [Cervus elaphus hippelaphus]|uniref:Protein tweety homolog n=1 Tax=Cervus elaphus hippelaphus TaxID=46360 RepID=A0A212CY68_CEREH|nr:hypothetical protein Celaphus_00007359 [Cervus elaphus hippelaphus]
MAGVSYAAPWWVSLLHRLPHFDLHWEATSSQFRPEDTDYQQATSQRALAWGGTGPCSEGAGRLTVAFSGTPALGEPLTQQRPPGHVLPGHPAGPVLCGGTRKGCPRVARGPPRLLAGRTSVQLGRRCAAAAGAQDDIFTCSSGDWPPPQAELAREQYPRGSPVEALLSAFTPGSSDFCVDPDTYVTRMVEEHSVLSGGESAVVYQPLASAHSCPRAISAGIAVGFYGNGETSDGIHRATYSLRHANRTVAGVQDRVSGRMGRGGLFLLLHPCVCMCVRARRGRVREPSLSQLTASPNLEQVWDTAAALNRTAEPSLQNLERQLAARPEPLRAVQRLQGLLQMLLGYTAAIPFWRNPAVSLEALAEQVDLYDWWLGYLGLLLLDVAICLLVLVGLIRSSKGILVGVCLLGVLALIISWGALGLELAVSVKLSGSHKALVEMQDVVAELLKTVSWEYPATKDPLLRVQEVLNGTEVNLQHLTALVDCRSLHLDYVQALTGFCYDGVEGLIYLALFSFVTALMFSSVVCSVPHTWQQKRGPDEDGEEEAAPGPRQAHDSLYRVHYTSSMRAKYLATSQPRPESSSSGH